MYGMMNQYELLAPFQNKNAGFSRWTFAKKNNKEYILKEFFNPVYPTDESISSSVREQRILDCEEYETKKRRMYEAVDRASDGNLVRIKEFFRYDNHYYIAMERIEAENISLDEIYIEPYESKILLCKTIAHAVMRMHQEKLVHADIKMNNILVKRTEKGK